MSARPDLAQYLHRLGVEAEPPSADALARLHRAHVERIPYESLWIHLAEGWGIDPDESARRLASTTRGGYCFQLNGAFATLLRHLGYEVAWHVGAVHGPDGPTEAELGNHAAVLVSGCPSTQNPAGRWWVDAGLGDALHDPLPLVPGTYDQAPMRFTLARVEDGGLGTWHVDHDPSGSFAGVSLVEAPVAMAAFAERHAYFSTAPESPFVRVATAQRRHAGGTSIVRGRVFTRTDRGTVTTALLETAAEWTGLLADEFGIVLDASPAQQDDLWARIVRSHETRGG